MMPSTSTLLDGRYQLLSPLGEGGMGAVYRAVQTSIGREVAVKLLHGRSPEATRDFFGEARACSALRHPHVVPVHDFGLSEQGVPYLVMELAVGISLSQRLRDGPIPVADAVRIAVQVCAGLAAAHRLGIVHADIKPANLMIGEREGVGLFAQIVDFGIARWGPSSRGGRGSPRYMAPEQRGLGMVDARADLWAVGMTLYEMLAGTHPHAGLTLDELLASPAVAPLASLELPLPSALVALVDQCLQRHPSDRPESAEAVRQRLVALNLTSTEMSPPRSLSPEPGVAPTSTQGTPLTLDTGAVFQDSQGAQWRVEHVTGFHPTRARFLARNIDDGRRQRFRRMHIGTSPDAISTPKNLDTTLAALATLDPTAFCTFRAGWYVDDVLTLAGDPLVGRPLGARLAEAGRLERDEICQVATGLLGHLNHLHEQGYVHGSIGPNTVRLHDGVVLADPMLTELTGTRPGSDDPFRAPEQLDGLGRTVGPSADLHAVGVLLYTLSTGHHPYGTDTDRASLVARKLEAPGPLETLHDPWLADLVRHLLQPGIADRPTSAAQVARAFATPPPALLHPLSPQPVRGRQPQQQAFRQALARAHHQQGSSLGLRGPSGSGRTALLESYAREARQQGAIVLQARGSGILPLSTVQQLFAGLDAAIDLRSEEEQAHLLTAVRQGGAVMGGWLREVSPLFAELFHDAPPLAPHSAAAARARLLDALVALPGWMAEVAPVVLLIDDADGVDDPSRTWLDAMCRRQPSSRCLVVQASRSAMDHTTPLALPALEPGAFRAALEDRIGAEAASHAFATLLQHSGGMPGAMVDGLRDALEAKCLLRQGDRWSVDMHALETLPPAVPLLERLVDDLMELPESCDPVLLALAIEHPARSIHALGALAGCDADQTRDAVAEGFQAQLLSRESNGRIRFRHDVLRDAALSLGDRDTLDTIRRRAIEQLLQTPDAPRKALRLATHLLECSIGPEDAIWLERGAIAALAASDGALATRLAEEAKRRRGTDADAELDHLRASGQMLKGEFEAAAASLLEAESQSTRVEQRSELIAELCVVLTRLGRPEEADHHQTRMLEELGFTLRSAGPRRHLRTAWLVLTELMVRPFLRPRIGPGDLHQQLVARLLLLRFETQRNRPGGAAPWLAMEGLSASRKGSADSYLISLEGIALIVHVTRGLQHLAGRLGRLAAQVRPHATPVATGISDAFVAVRQAAADGGFPDIAADDTTVFGLASHSARSSTRGTWLIAGYLRALKQGRIRAAAKFAERLGQGPRLEGPPLWMTMALSTLAGTREHAGILRAIVRDTSLQPQDRLRALGPLIEQLVQQNAFEEAIDNVDRWFDALGDVEEFQLQRAAVLSLSALAFAKALHEGRVPAPLTSDVAATVRMLLDEAWVASDAFADLRSATALADALLRSALGRPEAARKRLRACVDRVNALKERALVQNADLLFWLAILEGGPQTPTGRSMLEQAEEHARLADPNHPTRRRIDHALSRSQDQDASLSLQELVAPLSAWTPHHAPLQGPLIADRAPRTLMKRARQLLRTHGRVAFLLFIGMSMTTHAAFFLLFASGTVSSSWVSGAGVGAFVASTIANRMTRSIRLVATLLLTPSMGRLLGRRTPRSFD